MAALEALIGDLEAAVQDGQHDKRVAMLRQVTDLFLDISSNLSAEQADVFGDVLVHLTKEVEDKVLAELGAKLAPIDNAPNTVIQNLARHDEIAVAGPVLSQANGLSDNDLIEIAKTKSQGHLGAISERERLTENVTDVLVARGNTDVVIKLAGNDGAAFSRMGFDTMVRRAETNETLAERLGSRVDLPPAVLEELMAKATEVVRVRIQALRPEIDIQNVLTEASRQVLREAGVSPRNYRHAEALVSEMAEKNKLNEEAIVTFVKKDRYEEMVAGLAKLCRAPTDMIAHLVENPSYEGLLVACRAAGFSWPTLRTVFARRTFFRPMSEVDVETARTEFNKLSVATAQRVLRFWLVRGVAKRSN